MSNVVTFPFAKSHSAPSSDIRFSGLLSGFAAQRRAQDDVLWLKENAEVLGILNTTDMAVPSEALDVYAPFYEQIEQRLDFFPQYYRFFLSICLDLEDMGMAGDKAARMCARAAEKRWVDAELSDLQRGEARRLLARRGLHVGPNQGDLGARLNAFIERSTTFAMPNKKAAYELTHIVFYLSEYGRKDPKLSDAARVSLVFSGLLAYLDQNTDLLAEVCAAQRFAGVTPSPIWEAAVAAAYRDIKPITAPAQVDAYHAYLVTGWAEILRGAAAFDTVLPEGPMYFGGSPENRSILRPMSECLHDLGPQRSGDWAKMRGHVLSYLGPEGHEVLYNAEQSSDMFEAFFEGFARAAPTDSRVALAQH